MKNRNGNLLKNDEMTVDTRTLSTSIKYYLIKLFHLKKTKSAPF
jgi:hypothetical protein